MVSVLKSGYYETHLRYDNVAWMIDEVSNLANKLAFVFKNTNRDFIMTREDEKEYRKKHNCQFCEKELNIDKVRGHCHLTGNYRGPAQDNCTINVTQKQSNFIPFVFFNFSNYDCHLFFKSWLIKRMIN